MQLADSPRQTGEAVRSAAPRTLPGVPSWGRVLATTLGLWASRRVVRLRRPRVALILAVCVLAAAVVSVVQFTGTSAPAARVSPPGSPHKGQVRAGGSGGSAGIAGTVRAQAAAWVAGRVGSAETIGCDPLMCAALGGHGVATGRLVPLGPEPSAAADVIVASPSARLSQAAPTLLASFGSGASMIEVRAAAPGGSSATYRRALQADLAARRSGGAQLLHSRRIGVSAQAAGQLQAGEVDSRLLVMLAMLASQHPWRVIAFGDASPGVPLTAAPFRQVVIAGVDSPALAAALALVRAQRAPYQPAQVSTVRLPDGQAGLRIDFAAPSPLGLLAGGATG
jgi:hypothetical protein